MHRVCPSASEDIVERPWSMIHQSDGHATHARRHFTALATPATLASHAERCVALPLPHVTRSHHERDDRCAGADRWRATPLINSPAGVNLSNKDAADDREVSEWEHREYFDLG
jgi:hypothetical protein